MTESSGGGRAEDWGTVAQVDRYLDKASHSGPQLHIEASRCDHDAEVMRVLITQPHSREAKENSSRMIFFLKDQSIDGKGHRV